MYLVLKSHTILFIILHNLVDLEHILQHVIFYSISGMYLTLLSFIGIVEWMVVCVASECKWIIYYTKCATFIV